MSSPPIYLDYNGTTPIHPEIRQMMIQTLQTQPDSRNTFISQDFGNPSSTHHYGIESKISVNTARKQVAQLLNCDQSEIIFTSGGTESNNIAIQGVICQSIIDGNHSPHVVTTAFEHPSVEDVLMVSKQMFNAKVSTLPVDQFGFIDLKQLRDFLTPSTVLVTIMLANNEIGTINPMNKIYAIIQEYNKYNNVTIKLHMDCSQAVGKIPIDAKYADLLTLAGHKMYAPKGIGCLYIKQNTKLYKLQQGANQEQNIRPGTENVLYVKALGLASELSSQQLQKRMQNHSHMIQQLYNKLKHLNHKVNGYSQQLFENQQFEQHFINNNDVKCLPNTLNISFPGIQNSSIIAAVSSQICVSAGAACHSDQVTISNVLKAIGISPEVGMGTLRISIGDGLSVQQVEKAGSIIAEAVELYQQSGQSQTVYDHSNVHQNETKVAPVQVQLQYQQQSQNHTQNEKKSENQKQNLLNFTQGLGCACKLRPQLLDRILKSIDFGKDSNLLIDNSTNDDAAVYMLNENSVVLTTDFFSPVIDDPYAFGAIAAANALSDIYAMNSKPLTCLAVTGFNSARMTDQTMKDIIQGAADKCAECGVVIAGGHSIESVEPFFGLVCVGNQPNNLLIKRNLIQQLNQDKTTYLVLTKKIGVGMVTTALKKGILQKLSFYQQTYNDTVNNMVQLNNSIEKIPVDLFQSISAVTDITGFGLIGHLSEMLGPKYSAELYFKSIELIDNLSELYNDFSDQVINNYNNLEYVTQKNIKVQIQNNFVKAAVCDPVTSGGLLYAVQGIEEAQKVVSFTNGKLIGRVYQCADQQQQEIIIVNEVFRELKQRYVGFFKE